MYIFWNNIFKFPRFFISVILGLILIGFNFVIKLLNKPQQSLLTLIIIGILSSFLLQVLRQMLGLN